MKRFCLFLSVVFILASLISFAEKKSDYEIYGNVESKRKDNIMTVLFKNRPLEQSYLIIYKEETIGSIELLETMDHASGKYRYRSVARYELKNKKFSRVLKVGADICLVKPKDIYEKEYTDMKRKNVISNFKNIISDPDQREMIFIPQGKFVFGSNRGENDEYPEHLVYLDSYYIDKYEVSNSDYKKYIDATYSKSPRSWKDGKFSADDADLPVMVTYHEALSYAKWAGKRLPTEQEWEKAARGPGLFDDSIKTISYPWGNDFRPEYANCREFWANGVANEIKKKFYLHGKGLLPVVSFEKGSSPYGAINMSGNAGEWTSSWYRAYSGNKRSDKRYGSQYKVIRGGAWYSPRDKIRAASRQVGGIPDLYSDNTAGFRCVRKAKILDRQADHN